MTDNWQPPAPPPGGGLVPQGGVFAQSEVLGSIKSASQAMRERREEWLALRQAANEAKARPRKSARISS